MCFDIDANDRFRQWLVKIVLRWDLGYLMNSQRIFIWVGYVDVEPDSCGEYLVEDHG